jgi:hypothetical protein
MMLSKKQRESNLAPVAQTPINNLVRLLDCLKHNPFWAKFSNDDPGGHKVNYLLQFGTSRSDCHVGACWRGLEKLLAATGAGDTGFVPESAIVRVEVT